MMNCRVVTIGLNDWYSYEKAGKLNYLVNPIIFQPLQKIAGHFPPSGY